MLSAQRRHNVRYSISDSFDAMISKRSYKVAMPIEQALEEIERNAGTQFNPELAAIFVESCRSGKITI